MSTDKKPQITVKDQDGNEITVDLPDGYVAQADVDKDYLKREVVNDQYVLKATMDDRFKNWVHKDKAIEDQSVIKAILDKHKPKGDGDLDLDTAKGQWKTEMYDPLLEKYDRMIALTKGARMATLAAELFESQYVNSPVPGKPSYIETLFGPEIAFNEDKEYFVQVDAKGNPLPAQNPTTERPYAGIEEFLSTKAEDDSFKHLLKPRETNNSSNYNGNDSNNSNNTKSSVDLSKYKPRNEMTTDEKLKALEELDSHALFLQIPADRPES